MIQKKHIFFFVLSVAFIIFLLLSCAGPTEKLFIEKCSKCHGTHGAGKSASVDFMRQKFTVEKIRSAIEHGKGEMTKFPEIKEPELTLLVNYVAGLYQEN
ncbi:c-type cytochrome [Calditrichota bacterium]